MLGFSMKDSPSTLDKCYNVYVALFRVFTCIKKKSKLDVDIKSLHVL